LYDEGRTQVPDARLKMTLTISLPPETERALRERAACAGQTVERYIQQLVEQELGGTSGGPRSPGRSPSSLAETLAPVREEFEQSGLTDEDLATLVEEVREKIWQEKQTRKVP
jgi:hypothetical protein